MKHLNFLSSLGSQSGSHRVVTKAVTIGSPSAHRRGAMLKLLTVLVLILTLGVGQMWGTTTANVNDYLWREQFTNTTTNTSTTFSASSATDISGAANSNKGTSMLTSADISSLSYTASDVMLTASSGGNCDGAHIWVNKKTTGYFQVENIPVYNATKIKILWNQGGGSKITASYKLDNGSWTSAKENSSAGEDVSSDDISITAGTTYIAVKFVRTSTNTNIRLDDLRVLVTEIAEEEEETPSLTLTGSGAFSDVETSSTKDLNFTLTGSNLTANASVSVTGSGFSLVAPDGGSLTQTSGSITGSNNITVRFSPTATSTYEGTLTVTSTGATNASIALSGTGIAPTIKHKAYFYNGTTLLNEGGTEFAEGAAVSYSGTAPTSCDTGDGASTTFAGWATATWDGKVAKNAIVPSFYESTLPVMGENDVTYYAVFCKSGAPTLATSIAANDVVYLATAADGSGVTGYDGTKDATTSTTISEWMPFTVSAVTGGFTLSNGNNVVIAASSSFKVTIGTATTLTFEQDGSTGKYRMIMTSGTDKYALGINSSYKRFYKTSNSYTWFYVLKNSAGTNYMTTCCTPLGSINGSFLLHQLNGRFFCSFSS